MKATRIKLRAALSCLAVSLSAAVAAGYNQGEKAKFLAPRRMPDGFFKGGKKYGNLIRKKLFIMPGDYARVIVIPAFEPEVVITLDAVNGQKGNPQFSITIAQPSSNLFYTIPQPAATDEHGKPVPGATPYPLNKITIKKRMVQIDATLAAAIHETWVRLISRAQTPPEEKPPLVRNILGVDETSWFYSVKLPDRRVRFAELPLIRTETLERFRLLASGFMSYCEDPKHRSRDRQWLLEDLARIGAQLAKQ